MCKEWRDNIRSTDPVLRDKMFKDRVVPPQDETRSGEKANDKKENMKHNKGADDDGKQKSDSDKYRSNTTDKTEENVPTVTVNLRAAADLLCVPGSFPEAMIRFEVDFNTDYGCGFAPDDCNQLSNFPSGTNFHPILLNLDERLPLVDNVFQATGGVPHKNFGFDSFDSLDDVLERMRKYSRSRNDGSWKDMLLCEPAQPRINVVFDYTYYTRGRRKYKLYGEGGCGVTMGQFVRAFRKQLTHIEEDICGFPEEMLAYCGECWERNHED